MNCCQKVRVEMGWQPFVPSWCELSFPDCLLDFVLYCICLAGPSCCHSWSEENGLILWAYATLSRIGSGLLSMALHQVDWSSMCTLTRRYSFAIREHLETLMSHVSMIIILQVIPRKFPGRRKSSNAYGDFLYSRWKNERRCAVSSMSILNLYCRHLLDMFLLCIELVECEECSVIFSP